MNNLVCEEYEIEEGYNLSPSDFDRHHRISPTEYFALCLDEPFVYWIRENKMLYMSKDFAKLHYPEIHRLYQRLRYD